MPKLSAETSISSSNHFRNIQQDKQAVNQLTDRDTFRVDEIVQSSFDQLRKVIRQMLVTNVMQVVVIRVLRHPAIKVCPC